MRTALPLICITVGLLCIVGCAEGGNGLDKVNGSVAVQPGIHVGDASTVNGAIEIGHDATVAGAETVNGSIDLGPHAHANSLETGRSQESSATRWENAAISSPMTSSGVFQPSVLRGRPLSSRAMSLSWV